jgi:uncharacterized membrane protein (UPF0127 family)
VLGCYFAFNAPALRQIGAFDQPLPEPALAGFLVGLHTMSSMKRITHHITALLLTVLCTTAWAQNSAERAQMDLPRVALQALMHRIDAQVAQTPRQREVGLMYREKMPVNEGMLFVFEQPSVQCFWMRNTRIPLTAAFVADDGTIVNLADMKPMSDDSHCSKKPVRYVLEMNQGWFAAKGMKAGSKLTGPPFTP